MTATQAQMLAALYQSAFHARAWDREARRLRILDRDGVTVLYEFSTDDALSEIEPLFDPLQPDTGPFVIDGGAI